MSACRSPAYLLIIICNGRKDRETIKMSKTVTSLAQAHHTIPLTLTNSE